MSKMRYSAEQLCHMDPNKYIAVNHTNKDDNSMDDRIKFIEDPKNDEEKDVIL